MNMFIVLKDLWQKKIAQISDPYCLIILHFISCSCQLSCAMCIVSDNKQKGGKKKPKKKLFLRLEIGFTKMQCWNANIHFRINS